jgi:phosphatidylglycerophosphate synthase
MSPIATSSPVVRVNRGVLAGLERRLLIWMAERLPHGINSDHLTAVGALAMIGVGGCFWLAASSRAALIAVIPLLALNWFGDSLDGTVARVRHVERPRYGYYVDHVLDAAGFAALIGGLILGQHMSVGIGLGLLAAYYLLVIEVALGAHALGAFRMSFWNIGPTELRILLAAGVLQLWRSPELVLFGSRWRLFDVGGACGIAGFVLTFAVAAYRNARTLYREEPLPRARA